MPSSYAVEDKRYWKAVPVGSLDSIYFWLPDEPGNYLSPFTPFILIDRNSLDEVGLDGFAGVSQEDGTLRWLKPEDEVWVTD